MSGSIQALHIRLYKRFHESECRARDMLCRNTICSINALSPEILLMGSDSLCPKSGSTKTRARLFNFFFGIVVMVYTHAAYNSELNGDAI